MCSELLARTFGLLLTFVFSKRRKIADGGPTSNRIPSPSFEFTSVLRNANSTWYVVVTPREIPAVIIVYSRNVETRPVE